MVKRSYFLYIYPHTEMTACEKIQHVQQFKFISVMKLTKSLPIIKERNCNASLVLDIRTNRKNVSIRFTVDRKFFYHQVGGFYSEKRFSDICTATKSSSENYKEQKMWREDIVPKYKKMLVGLNKGNPFTYEMVRVAVTTGNANVEVAKEDKSFIGI